MNEALDLLIAAAEELGAGTHTVGDYRVVINATGELISVTRR